MSPTPTAAAVVIPKQRTPETAGPIGPAPPVGAPPRSRRFVTAGLVCSGLAVMLLGYLRIARANGTNADGAANALQAWDILHGNAFLAGWTLSDVSFFPTELIQYTLIELFCGLRPDVVHVAAASTYVLLIVFAALAARGDATGRAAWVRVGVVVAVMLVPQPHAGWSIVLNTPDHTGTGVPLLLTALLVDRRAALRRWWPVVVTAVLAVAQMGDPLAMYIGAIPLALVSAVRLAWSRRRAMVDAHLLVAAVASILLAHAAVKLIGLLGGYQVHPPIAEFTKLEDVPDHLDLLWRTVAVDYGAYFPYLGDDWTVLFSAAAAIKFALMLTALAATLVTIGRLLRRGGEPDRVAQWLAVAIVVNLAAYVASTQAGDMASARQVVAVLPFGAVLIARVLADRVRPSAVTRWVAGALAAVLVGAFAVQTALARPAPTEAAEVAAWLEQHDLHYGVGAYWASNTITVQTGGRVQVAPIVDEVPRAFHWESRREWFDPRRHDANFVVVDRELERYGTLSGVVLRLGAPIQQVDFTRWTVLVYDHDVLPYLPRHQLV
ncbi:hypothetical protein [Dactylosporangium matsuzakiense]|uniref:Uncharacterized protein n=1 Tax=Dactylosporangium matsuzakiense TaxID=53360 RepID=A0A9W6KCS5_9ACTN|nr:hypothetical protein [Dactylosporangium matsuzakiense]UWZ42090.1 hypothetical protein Dmats_31380 [Dactylosporangium matsuzakiense]GLK99716.1 hypothetical protein GCM10017581_014570 [Dactylosporangium matsuzakiense]